MQEEENRLMCVALTSFTDQSNGDELTFHKGDVITLDPFEYQNTGDEEWYQGTYQNSTGVFPNARTYHPT